jgi:phage terminase large subunit-like protein
VTLVNVLRDLRGMQIREIERTKSSGSKTQRFLEIQPYIASKRISLCKNAKHVEMCLKHMSKITANNSHRHDDICDTIADGIRIALIEKTIYSIDNRKESRSRIMSSMNQSFKNKMRLAAAKNVRIS